MTGVLMQVRLGSSRLRGKALLPLGNRSVIEHAMLALRHLDAAVFALLSDEASGERLRIPAELCGYQLFCGHATDVLKRYIDAARYYRVQTIVRATGDNPVVSGPLAQSLLRVHRESGADLSGYDELPLGCGVEIVQRTALERACALSDDAYDHEHVTAFLYANPQDFVVWRKPAPAAFRAPEARVTIDSLKDYQVLRDLFDQRYSGEPLSIETVIEWWHSNGRKREVPR